MVNHSADTAHLTDHYIEPSNVMNYNSVIKHKFVVGTYYTL